MFDKCELPAVASCNDAGLIDVMVAAARFEAAAMAHRLAAAAELYHRRERAQDAAERDQWLVDGWQAVAAEIAAALGVSRGRAAGLLRVGLDLRDRLPKVAAVFAEGRVDYRVVSAVVSRTSLIEKDEDVARIDAELAARVPRWNRLSDKKIIDKIDQSVVYVDNFAQRVRKEPDEGRHVGVGPDRRGMADLWGTLRAPDALALDARLTELAGTVCPADPRSKDQRRADATGALAAGQDQLACACGSADCPAGTQAPAVGNVVINVLAEPETLRGDGDKPAYVPGYGVLDAEALRDLAKRARLRFVKHPGESPAEPGYRPSAALATFVRSRDLTCRFPGCDVPAEFCDIDHTVPFPYGPTHASNLKLMCWHDHLLKTFYAGPGGWADTQLPDGTVIWKSPTGHTYATKPVGALFFPQLELPTGELVLPDAPPPSPGRGLMMPTRARTRAQNQRSRVKYERGLNYQRLVLDVDPPPF